MTLQVCPGVGGLAWRRPHFLTRTSGEYSEYSRMPLETDAELRARIASGIHYCMVDECCGEWCRSNRRGYGPIVHEVTQPDEVLAAYRLGGLEAAMGVWYGVQPERYYVSTLRVTIMDFLYVTGRIPQRFREADGSADGWELPKLGGEWRRVFFPPLEWPRLDLYNMLHGNLFATQ